MDPEIQSKHAKSGNRGINCSLSKRKKKSRDANKEERISFDRVHNC